MQWDSPLQKPEEQAEFPVSAALQRGLRKGHRFPYPRQKIFLPCCTAGSTLRRGPVTVSMTPSGKYFASVLVDTAIQELPVSPIQGDTALGIDLGIKSLAVCSDGRTFDNPKNLQHSLDRLGLAAEAVEPQTERFCQPQQGTHPRGAAAGTYRELPQGRHLHKITHVLTDDTLRTLCMENLNVKGMQSNHHLAQAVGETLPSGCS